MDERMNGWISRVMNGCQRILIYASFRGTWLLSYGPLHIDQLAISINFPNNHSKSQSSFKFIYSAMRLCVCSFILCSSI